MSPAEAIKLALQSYTERRATVDLQVASTGEGAGPENGIVYLNSGENYRDLQSLNVAISPAVARDFEKKFSQRPQELLKGKRIRVTGILVRVKTGTMESSGKITPNGAFQTHLNVQKLADITFLDSP